MVIYATGVRGRNSLTNVKVNIGAQQLSAAYAGSTDPPHGVDIVNVILPRSLAGAGSVNVSVAVENQQSNAGRIVIK